MMNPRTAVAAVLLVVLHAIAPRPGIVRLVDGQPDGVEILWYEDGRPESLRVYRNGHKVGRHYGWWPDGTPRFDAGYGDDAFEGEYRGWHKNGRPLEVRHYRDGREDGLQRAWSEDGELYLNYEVRNSRRYGFVNAKPCLPVAPEVAGS